MAHWLPFFNLCLCPSSCPLRLTPDNRLELHMTLFIAGDGDAGTVAGTAARPAPFHVVGTERLWRLICAKCHAGIHGKCRPEIVLRKRIENCRRRNVDPSRRAVYVTYKSTLRYRQVVRGRRVGIGATAAASTTTATNGQRTAKRAVVLPNGTGAGHAERNRKTHTINPGQEDAER